MNLERIRSKALRLGLIDDGQTLTDEEIMQLVLEPGFSTAENLTQAAGRGVGMDVVANEVKKLGGSLLMETQAGKGSRFTIRLPLSLSVGHAVIVRVGGEQYALPMPTIEGVVRIPREELQQHLASQEPSYAYGGVQVPPAASGQLRRTGSRRRCLRTSRRCRWCWCAPASCPRAWWPRR